MRLCAWVTAFMMIGVGVVMWVVVVMAMHVGMMTGPEAVVVIARSTGTHVHADDGSWLKYHIDAAARSIPPESQRLEVFEGSQGKQLRTHFIIRFDGIGKVGIETISRDIYDDSLDPARTDSDVFTCVIVAVVRFEIKIEIARIAFIADILDIVIHTYGVVRVGHHRL